MINTGKKTHTANESTRKRPGRPRIAPRRVPEIKYGVSSEPRRHGNIMEFMYDGIPQFKKLFVMFKSMNIDVIKMTFNPSQISIHTSDHLCKSIIHVVIDCTKMNHYYCKHPYTVAINPTNMEKIIRILDKSYTTINLISKESEWNKVLHIIYKNDMKIDEYRTIDLINIVPNNSICDVIDDSKYQVKFTLPCKFFKKMIGDIYTFSNTLTFEKTASGPLSYSYVSLDKTLKSKHVVTDNKIINLECNMLDNDIFGMTIVLDYIKALSVSLLTDNIRISADTSNDIIFQSYMDNNAINIKVKTQTVNRRT